MALSGRCGAVVTFGGQFLVVTIYAMFYKDPRFTSRMVKMKARTESVKYNLLLCLVGSLPVSLITLLYVMPFILFSRDYGVLVEPLLVEMIGFVSGVLGWLVVQKLRNKRSIV